MPALAGALRLVLAAQTGRAYAPRLDATKPYFSDYAYEQRDAALSMERAESSLAALKETPRLQWFRW